MGRTCFVICYGFLTWVAGDAAWAQNRYATSDSNSDYVHWIDLYDGANRRIDPTAENPRPYSPRVTCGRCHEFDTISHGWHFNAVDPQAKAGRPGPPWIWSDDRTGTHLPLSYRGWTGTFDPDAIGISRWQMAAEFGGYLPGGGPGSEEALAESTGPPRESDPEDGVAEGERGSVTGPLPVDCMICHFRPGSGYSPFTWTEQIEKENFPYAPTAAAGIGVVEGSMERLDDDFDPSAEGAAEKLPQLKYQSDRFRADGKVFFDLVRNPAKVVTWERLPTARRS